MPTVTVEIPTSLKIALDKEIARAGGNESTVIIAALARHLGTPVHTLFQISTSGALVAGVYSRAVSVRTILDHGDFGLGTFARAIAYVRVRAALSQEERTRFDIDFAVVLRRAIARMPS